MALDPQSKRNALHATGTFNPRADQVLKGVKFGERNEYLYHRPPETEVEATQVN